MYLHSNISVIIPAHKYDLTLDQCLKSYELLNQKPLEIIIALDGIEINTDFFNKYYLPLIITKTTTFGGPSLARNLGASIANGSLLYFSDSDVKISKDTLDKVIVSFNKDEDVDAIIGSYDDKPFEMNIVSHYRNLLHHFVHQEGNKEAVTFWGACGAIKKEVFRNIGGFNTKFTKPSVEDIELGYRLKEAGYRISLEKSMLVKHLKKWTLFSMVKTDVFYRAMPWTKLLIQYNRFSESNLNVNLIEKVLAILLIGICFCVILGFTLSVYFFILGLFLIFILALLKLKLYTFFSKHFKLYKLPVVILLHWIFIASSILGFTLAYIDLKRDKLFKNIDESS